MDPLTIGLITGGSSLLGSIFSSNASAQASEQNTMANIAAQRDAQHETMQFNAAQADANRQFGAEQADANRQFQQQMSSTAFQRSRADAIAAGINPMALAGMGGASTPSGGQASGSAASVGTPNMALSNRTSPLAGLAGLGDAMSKAVNSAIQAKTFDKMTNEISNIQADTAKTKAVEAYVGQQTKTEENETLRRANEASKSGLAIPAARVSAKEAEAILAMPAWLRDTVVQGGYAGKKVSDTLKPVETLSSTAKSILPRSTTSERSRSSAGGGDFDEFWQSRTGFSR